MAQRYIMRIELKGTAKQKLSSLSEQHGMTQVAMMSRLIEWFSAQDEPVQSAAMARSVDKDQPDVAKLILNRMANKKKG